MGLGLVLLVGAGNEGEQDASLGQAIVTVDLKAVLTNSLAGKAVQVKFREQLKKAKAQIDEKTELLKAMERDLSTTAGLEETERRNKQRAFDKEKLQLKLLVQNTQDDLEAKQDDLMGSVTQEVKVIIERIAKEKGYGLVLASSPPSVIYSSGVIDSTAEALEALDAQWLEKIAQ